jgi:hypothetical protein
MASGTVQQPHQPAPAHGTKRGRGSNLLWAILGVILGAAVGSLAFWVEREGNSTIYPKEVLRVRVLGVPVYREVANAPPDIPIPEGVRPQQGWSYGHATAVCVVVATGDGTGIGRAWGLSLLTVCAAVGGVVVWKWRWRALAVGAAAAALLALIETASMLLSGGS